MYEGRIRMTVRYDGTAYAGSQIQPGKRTIAGSLKSGLESIFRQDVHLLFAGRTDAGVHANGNICACDITTQIALDKLPGIINSRLPEDIAIRELSPAPPSFHPRFDALARTYSYTVYTGADVPVDRMRYVMEWPKEIPLDPATAALEMATGKHAFQRFAEGSLSPQYSLCELDPVMVETLQDQVRWRIRGNRFLRQMVRRLVGAALQVARGKASLQQFRDALDGEHGFQFTPAPAKGLVLEQVEYRIEDTRNEYDAVFH